MNTVFYTTLESPVGTLLLAGDSQALRMVSFQSSKHAEPPQADWKQDKAPFAEVIRQLRAYFRRAERIRSSIGAGGNGISTSRLEQAAYDSLWRDDFLRTARGAHRQSQSRACCGLGEWEQSDTDHHSVPPGHRQRWQPDRFWRRPSHQEDAS